MPTFFRLGIVNAEEGDPGVDDPDPMEVVSPLELVLRFAPTPTPPPLPASDSSTQPVCSYANVIHQPIAIRDTYILNISPTCFAEWHARIE